MRKVAVIGHAEQKLAKLLPPVPVVVPFELVWMAAKVVAPPQRAEERHHVLQRVR